MDWQLVASYFTVNSTDIFYDVRVSKSIQKKNNLLTVPNKVSKSCQQEVSSACMYMRVLNLSCDYVSSVPIEPVRVAQSVKRLTLGPGLDTRSRYILSSHCHWSRAVITYWPKNVHLVVVNSLGGSKPVQE